MLGDERQSRGRDRAPSPHPKTTAPDFALSPSRYRASLLRRLSRGRATLRLPKAEGIQAEKRVELAKAEPPPPPPPPPSPGREEGRVLSPEGYEADDEAARVQITWMCDELSHLSGLTFRLHDSPPHNLWATGPTTLAHLPVREAQPRILDLQTSSLGTQQLYDPLYFHPRLLAPPLQASAVTGVDGVQEEEAGQGYAEEEDVIMEKSMRVHFNSKTWQHAQAFVMQAGPVEPQALPQATGLLNERFPPLPERIERPQSHDLAAMRKAAAEADAMIPIFMARRQAIFADLALLRKAGLVRRHRALESVRDEMEHACTSGNKDAHAPHSREQCDVLSAQETALTANAVPTRQSAGHAPRTQVVVLKMRPERREHGGIVPYIQKDAGMANEDAMTGILVTHPLQSPPSPPPSPVPVKSAQSEGKTCAFKSPQCVSEAASMFQLPSLKPTSLDLGPSHSDVALAAATHQAGHDGGTGQRGYGCVSTAGLA